MRSGLLVALLVVSTPAVSRAQSAAPEGAESSDNATLAQQRYQRGIALYQTQQYGPALVEFRASMSIFGSPNSRLYIARCLRGLGQLAEAVAEYDLTAREASDRAANESRYVATREAAQNELRSVLPSVGHVTLEANALPPGARVNVGRRDIPQEGVGLSIPVMPGTVHVHIEAPGRAPIDRDVEVRAQSTVAVPLDLDAEHSTQTDASTATVVPPTETAAVGRSAGPLRTGAYASFVVGAAGFVTLGIFGALAISQYDTLNARCGMTRCPDSERDNVSTGRAYQTVANIGLGVGIAGAAVGAALFFLSGRRREPPVQVGFSGTTLSVGGTF